MKTERLRRKKLIFRDPFSLFPAQAGVIHCIRQVTIYSKTFPRASGGDPYIDITEIVSAVFSPRKRG